jgi:hypothetical protein
MLRERGEGSAGKSLATVMQYGIIGLLSCRWRWLMTGPIPPEVMQQINQCLFDGRKIEAIKLYREYTREGLKESKDFIDDLEKDLRTNESGRFKSPPGGKGCMGVVLVLLVVGGLAAVGVKALFP